MSNKRGQNGESNRDRVISAQCSDCQSGEANDWRNREHVVLGPILKLENGKDPVVTLVNLSSK